MYRHIMVPGPDGGNDAFDVRIAPEGVQKWIEARDRLREQGRPDRPPDVDTPNEWMWLPHPGEEDLRYFLGINATNLASLLDPDPDPFIIAGWTWGSRLVLQLNGRRDGSFSGVIVRNGEGLQANLGKDPNQAWAKFEDELANFVENHGLPTHIVTYWDRLDLEREVRRAEADLARWLAVSGTPGVRARDASSPPSDGMLAAILDRHGEQVTDPTSVSLVLLEGDRKGPVIARVDGWESRAFSFARTDWHKAIGHSQLGSLLDEPGVYVLTGPSSTPLRPRVYVGQADVLRSRLNTHLSDPGKVWWDRAAVFAGGLNKLSIAWLESELIRDAKIAGRSDLENGPQPNKPQMGWDLQQSMAQHYQRARLLLGIIDVDAFDPVPATVQIPGPATAKLRPSSEAMPGVAERPPTFTGRNVYIVVGEAEDSWRHWEDWISLGLVSGGLTPKIGKAMDRIKAGDRIFAYLSGHGYVGVGIAAADAAPINKATVWDGAGKLVPAMDLPFAQGWESNLGLDDPTMTERVVRVSWLATTSRDEGFFEKDLFHSPQTTCSLLNQASIGRILDHFGLLAAT